MLPHLLLRSTSSTRTIMSRPTLAVRLATTSHCIPSDKSLLESPKSSVPSLIYESSSSSDEPEEVPRARRASTRLISQNADDVRRIIGGSGTKRLENCCGGGCCMSVTKQDTLTFEKVTLPDNAAFKSLGLKIDLIPTVLSSIAPLPPKTVSLLTARNAQVPKPSSRPDPATLVESTTTESIDFTPHTTEQDVVKIDTSVHPPDFVQPHPPYNVFSAKLHHARELTKPGAEKRTYHFDISVDDYPVEGGVDFKVGGAIGIMAPNDHEVVEEILELLSIPRSLRGKAVLVKTDGGRWPTVWGEEEARELISTRRDLLTWTTDIQSYAPTKPLLRLLAEYSSDENDRKILMYLCSGEGQGTFCDLRADKYLSLVQLLNAFPSSQPPLDHLLSALKQLMPRFYSLSNDPHESCVPKAGCSRVIEIAVSVAESPDWRAGYRTGVGSGFMERQARAFIDAEARGEKPDMRIPMFKGLMANPLAREFVSDGPMLLIGAGVGVAPFRGFVQRRLKSANCANKVWVLQGVRDSLLDELYSGEWGVHESEVKKVVQSRKGVGKYVQEEVLNQKDLVWFVINALDGRIFLCGSSKGMGEGVEAALVEVAMEMGNLSRAGAEEFWKLKKDAAQFVSETW